MRAKLFIYYQFCCIERLILNLMFSFIFFLLPRKAVYVHIQCSGKDSEKGFRSILLNIARLVQYDIQPLRLVSQIISPLRSSKLM